MSSVQTETVPLSSVFNVDTHSQAVLRNNIAFMKAKTHEERYLLNAELDRLVKQIEEAAR